MSDRAGTVIRTVVADGRATVFLGGELDGESWPQVFDACLAYPGVDITLDLTDLRFLDCTGYRAVSTVRATLADGASSLCIRHATGEPARLLEMITEHEGLRCCTGV